MKFITTEHSQSIADVASSQDVVLISAPDQDPDGLILWRWGHRASATRTEINTMSQDDPIDNVLHVKCAKDRGHRSDLHDIYSILPSNLQPVS